MTAGVSVAGMGLDDGLDDPLADLRVAFPGVDDAVLTEWRRLFEVPGGSRSGAVASFNPEFRSALIDLDGETTGLLITTNPGMDPALGDRVNITLTIPQGPTIAYMLPEGS